MAGNTIAITFAGDSKSLEKSFTNVGTGAKKMADDLDKAGDKAGVAARAIDKTGEAADQSEGKFMATADVLDGLGAAFGLPTDAATGMFRAFGDLSGGFAGLQGLLSGGAQKVTEFGKALVSGEIFTKIWTGTQAAFNAVMSANPAVLIGIGIIALGAALVVAYQKSETFRNIVQGAFAVVKGAAEGVVNFFKDIPGVIEGMGNRLVDVITWPYKTAFNGIAKLWNNTVGRLSFSVPDWVPGIGGKGFSMPTLPTFHQGGVVPGNPGQAVPIMAMAGERVITASQQSSGPTIVNLVVDGRTLAQVVASNMTGNKRRGATLGFQS